MCVLHVPLKCRRECDAFVMGVYGCPGILLLVCHFLVHPCCLLVYLTVRHVQFFSPHSELNSPLRGNTFYKFLHYFVRMYIMESMV